MARAMQVGAAHDPAERRAETIVGQTSGQPVGLRTPAPANVEHAVEGVGWPLDPTVRKDISGPRTPSATAAPGRYQPATRESSKLLAHELAHVAQGDGATVRPYRDKGSQNYGMDEVLRQRRQTR